jgi:LAO/AO transport system kinase
MKAGLMEIADVFVVNKADRPGAERLLKEIRQSIHLRAGHALKDVPAHHGVDLGRLVKKERTEEPPPVDGGWVIPVLKTVAQTGEGVDELVGAVSRHRAWLLESGEIDARRRSRARVRVRDVVNRELRRAARGAAASGPRLEEGLDRIRDGDATPYSVAEEILGGILKDASVR